MSDSLREEILEKINEYERIAKTDRHKAGNKMQTAISIINNSMDESKENIINLKNDMKSVKKDIKNGFERIEEKIEEKFEVMMDKFATKLELKDVQTTADDAKKTADQQEGKIFAGLVALIIILLSIAGFFITNHFNG